MLKSAASAGMARSLGRDAAGRLCGAVEDVIAWAFREELPKMPRMDAPPGMAGGWDRTSRYGELLSLVDLHGVNGFGVVPDFSADRWPCDDARMIGDVVASLDDVELVIPEDWRPAPELDRFGGLGAKAVADAWRGLTRTDADGRLVLRLKPSHLVIRSAVMGARLAGMEMDGIEEKFEAFANGKVKWFVRRPMHVVVGYDAQGAEITRLENVEGNGWNEKAKRTHPDAYRKPYLDPDPVPVIMARAEHEIWHAALVLIHGELAQRLETVAMLPTRIPADPWNGMERSRILVDPAAERREEARQEEERRARFAARYPRWFARLERLKISA